MNIWKIRSLSDLRSLTPKPFLSEEEKGASAQHLFWRIKAAFERACRDRAAAVGTNSLAVHFRTMNTAVGLFAAVCTTLSYFPQLKKCWETGSAGDLSLKMFLTLAVGVATWIVYGFLQRDFVIILANAVSLCLLLGILYFKLREHRRG
jgi:MtN3 and saliva related transmembrane protein